MWDEVKTFHSLQYHDDDMYMLNNPMCSGIYLYVYVCICVYIYEHCIHVQSRLYIWWCVNFIHVLLRWVGYKPVGTRAMASFRGLFVTMIIGHKADMIAESFYPHTLSMLSAHSWPFWERCGGKGWCMFVLEEVVERYLKRLPNPHISLQFLTWIWVNCSDVTCPHPKKKLGSPNIEPRKHLAW